MLDPHDPAARAALLEAAVRSALRAGQAILPLYRSGCAVTLKADASPVTEADRAAEAIILADLAAAAPGVPVVAEEEVAGGRVPATADLFFLVDPLDGTREFVDGRDDFTVNIALVHDGAPLLGVVYAPAHGRLYAGDVADGGAWTAPVADGRPGAREALAVRAPPERLTVVASRSHRSAAIDAYLAALPVGAIVASGSSLKLCILAHGAADLYPRCSTTCEWDIAAGDAVLRAAGGRLVDAQGAPMRYGKLGFHNGGFVATGGFDPPPIAPFLP